MNVQTFLKEPGQGNAPSNAENRRGGGGGEGISRMSCNVVGGESRDIKVRISVRGTYARNK